MDRSRPVGKRHDPWPHSGYWRHRWRWQSGHLCCRDGQMDQKSSARPSRCYRVDSLWRRERPVPEDGACNRHGWHEGKLADVDGDGALDIINKSYTWNAPRVELWLNK